jgi:hypothetical protein
MAGAIAAACSASISMLSFSRSRANDCNSNTAFRRHAWQQTRVSTVRRNIGLHPLVVQAGPTEPAIVFQNNLTFYWKGRRRLTSSNWVDDIINILEGFNLRQTVYPEIVSFSELSKALTGLYPSGRTNKDDGLVTGEQYIQATFTLNTTNMKPLNERGALVVDLRGQPGLYDDLIDSGTFVMVPERPKDVGSTSPGPGKHRGAIVRLRIPFVIYGPAGSLSARLESKA